MIRKNINYDGILNILLALIIVLGVVARFYFYWADRSLFIDEAMHAVSLLSRSYEELLHPYVYNVARPIGYSLLIKFITLIISTSEYSLRLIPMLSGIASIFLFLCLLKKIGGKLFITIGMLFFCFNGYLIIYSSEFKHYSVELFFALLMTLIYLWYVESKTDVKRLVIFTGIGLVSIFMTYATMFVLAGILAIELFENRKRTNWKIFGPFLGIYLFLGAAIMINYFLFIRFFTVDQYYFENFSNWYPNIFILTKENYFHLVRFWTDLLKNPGYFQFPLMMTVLYLLGYKECKRRNLVIARLCIFPIIAALIAATCGKYSFHGRLLLFYVPFLIILISLGMIRLIQSKNYLVKCVGGIIVLLVISRMLIDGGKTYPFSYQEIKPVLEYIQEHKEAGDTLFISCGAKPAVQYYWPRFSLNNMIRMNNLDLDREGFYDCKMGDHVSYDFQKGQRIWHVQVSTVSYLNQTSDVAMELKALLKNGSLIDQLKTSGAAVRLIEITD